MKASKLRGISATQLDLCMIHFIISCHKVGAWVRWFQQLLPGWALLPCLFQYGWWLPCFWWYILQHSHNQIFLPLLSRRTENVMACILPLVSWAFAFQFPIFKYIVSNRVCFCFPLHGSSQPTWFPSSKSDAVIRSAYILVIPFRLWSMGLGILKVQDFLQSLESLHSSSQWAWVAESGES